MLRYCRVPAMVARVRVRDECKYRRPVRLRTISLLPLALPASSRSKQGYRGYPVRAGGKFEREATEGSSIRTGTRKTTPYEVRGQSLSEIIRAGLYGFHWKIRVFHDGFLNEPPRVVARHFFTLRRHRSIQTAANPVSSFRDLRRYGRPTGYDTRRPH